MTLGDTQPVCPFQPLAHPDNLLNMVKPTSDESETGFNYSLHDVLVVSFTWLHALTWIMISLPMNHNTDFGQVITDHLIDQ